VCPLWIPLCYAGGDGLGVTTGVVVAPTHVVLRSHYRKITQYARKSPTMISMTDGEGGGPLNDLESSALALPRLSVGVIVDEVRIWASLMAWLGFGVYPQHTLAY
jgi:hypothetical protein